LLNHNAAKKALAKRKRIDSENREFKLEDHLFKEQLAFVKDPSPNKVAVCSRRAGKTTACAADLVYTAINNPGTVSLYITLSRNNAKKIIWKEIKDLNRDYALKGELNLSELSVSFPNGSTIYLSGAKDTNEIEKFRGLALKLVYIDEAQSFRSYIEELINDILSPALMDYSGTLNLIGTPSPIPAGFFHDAYVKNKGFSSHHWTFWDNPFIIKKSKKTHREMMDRELKRRGVTLEDPSIQREYFGKWTLDSNSLLIHYTTTLNDFQAIPVTNPKRLNYIMGIDLGFDDADAIAVLAWSEDMPATYLIEEVVVRQQGLTELTEQIEFLRKKYDVSKLMIDQGGLGKKLAEEMRRRHGIPVQPADKARKMEHIAFLNDALRTGRFKAKSDSKFAQDSYLVEIDRDKSTPDKIKVSTAYHSDIIDAVLYAFVESPAFTYVKPKEAPKYGTKEWAEAQESNMFEAELEGLTEAHRLQKEYDDYGKY
jgi:PBSX family phage terminase large subunit